MAMVEKITDAKGFDSALSATDLVVVHFATEWAEQCGQITDAMEEITKQPEIIQNGTKLYVFPAEDIPELSLKYQVTAVPTVIFFRNKLVIDRVDGANVAQVTSKIKQHSVNVFSSPLPNNHIVEGRHDEEPLNVRLNKLINRHSIMVFMKGSRDAPRCGFSRQLMQIFGELNVNFETFDILSNEEVRQGLKVFSNWPTYPQVYVDGELIGGIDIIKEQQASGELCQILNISQTTQQLDNSLKINQI